MKAGLIEGKKLYPNFYLKIKCSIVINSAIRMYIIKNVQTELCSQTTQALSRNHTIIVLNMQFKCDKIIIHSMHRIMFYLLEDKVDDEVLLGLFPPHHFLTSGVSSVEGRGWPQVTNKSTAFLPLTKKVEKYYTINGREISISCVLIFI